MGRAQNGHYLRPNEGERSPHHVLIFDTETRTIELEHGAVQQLRIWCALEQKRHVDGPPEKLTKEYEGHTADELVELINKLAKGRRTLWVYAHNLAFDLVVTKLPILLIRSGWSMTDQGLFTDSPWGRFTKGGNRITLADSWSVVPTSVEQLGKLYMHDKPALPKDQDSDEVWFHRCREDVRITAKALLDCMDWWDREHCGNWSLTGPNMGWNAMRHGYMPVKVVIDPDPDARTFEREAITAGRRDVWKVGKQRPGVYLDIDFVHAHLTVCAEMRLPYRRFPPFAHLPLDSPMLRVESMDIIAEVEINTSEARYPMRTKSGIFYPVGRFKTVLCGPEIREAHKRGELVRIGKGYPYQMAHLMRPWALWVRGLMDGDDPELPPSVHVMLKGWSRSVPGKWAARTSELVDVRYDPRPGWEIEDGALMPGSTPAIFMRVEHEYRTYACDVDAENSFPAVLAFVQSYTRLALSNLVDEIGEAVLQTNTDGCLIDAVRFVDDNWRAGDTLIENTARVYELSEILLKQINKHTAPLEARIKKAAVRVDVISPQHVIIDKELRLAGIPRSAKEVSERRYHFTVWPKMRTQLSQGDGRGYVQKERTADLSRVQVNRWRLSQGICEPVRVDLTEDGTNELLAWDESWRPGAELLPVEYQHIELRRLLRGGVVSDT